MTIRIQLKRDTAANWTASARVLRSGEVGIETDTGKFKIGDGVTAWAGRPYYGTLAQSGGLSGADTDLTGMTAVQGIERKTDLAAGYALTHPDRITHVGVRFDKPAAVDWTKIAELTFVNAGQGSMRVRGTLALTSGRPFDFYAVLSVTAGNVYASSSIQWLGGSLTGHTYLRAYRDTNGSGQNRLSLYVYDNNTGGADLHVVGELVTETTYADNVINVWQAGDTPTATDPAGTKTEITRTSGLGGSAVTQSARTYFANDGGVTDPVVIDWRSDASTSITLTADDHMKGIRCTADTEITVTVNTGVVSEGFQCFLLPEGAGQIVFVAGGGMTQRCALAAKSRALQSPVGIVGITTTLYNVVGDLAAS